MIRITFLLRRKAELSLEAFQDYWLNEHGPLVAPPQVTKGTAGQPAASGRLSRNSITGGGATSR